MKLAYNYFSTLVWFMLLFPALCYSQDYGHSRATYYGSPDCLGTSNGACGFGEYGRNINEANVAGVSSLWRNGTGCGSCYQVKCKSPKHCSDDGVNLVVTDYGEGDHTDFILSPRAFTKLARPNMVYELFGYGVVDVEFRRIPCQYVGYNLMFKVHEHSKFPDYLAIIILYQAGMSDILSVQIWQEDCKEWKAMRRAYGGVYDIANPPKGAITLRFQLSSYGWVQSSNVIPGDWKAGLVYDSTVQLN